MVAQAIHSKKRSSANGKRLSPARQRRLNALIAKQKLNRLAVGERRELESLLDEVDRKSFWMLARQILEQPPATGNHRARRKAG